MTAGQYPIGPDGAYQVIVHQAMGLVVDEVDRIVLTLRPITSDVLEGTTGPPPTPTQDYDPEDWFTQGLGEDEDDEDEEREDREDEECDEEHFSEDMKEAVKRTCEDISRGRGGQGSSKDQHNGEGSGDPCQPGGSNWWRKK